MHGLYVSPDLDTMVYTLAGIEGSHGWGRAEDTFIANTELARFGVDNKFQLGDRDLALEDQSHSSDDPGGHPVRSDRLGPYRVRH